jgi:hypothetical protein
MRQELKLVIERAVQEKDEPAGLWRLDGGRRVTNV